MSFRRFACLALVAGALAAPVSAAQTGDDVLKADPIDRLRTFSLTLWPRFRETNQQYYTYVRAAADFRAYLDVCKRHDLNVHLSPVNRLAVDYLRQIVTAHYEEGEWAAFEGLSEAEKQALITDFAHDVFAYELALSLTEFRARATATGLLDKRFCETIVREYQSKYISLLTTARHQLEDR